MYTHKPLKKTFSLPRHVIFGIDPGKRGGIVVIDEEGGVLAKSIMPLKPDGGYNITSLYEFIRAILRLYKGKTFFYLFSEEVMQYSKGKLGLQSLGYCAGAINTLCVVLNIKQYNVAPKVWQKVILGDNIKDTKKESIDWVLKRYPHYRWKKNERARVYHDGLTDACCIAHYGLYQILAEQI